jgi:hypothetical protein
MKKLIFYLLLILFGTQNTSAQCNPDRHSTNWYDAWVSCNPAANPNSTHGTTHWIMYDFGEIYTLHESKFWNYNDPDNLDYGLQEIIIDYSLDGTSWTNYGTHQLNQSSGSLFYEGENGPDFNGIQARYLLITAVSNFGGSCFGLGEIKINLQPTSSIEDYATTVNISAYPNPFDKYLTVKLIDFDYTSEVTYIFTDLLGREIASGKLDLNNSNRIIFKEKQLNFSTGIYILEIIQGKNKASIKLIKK